MIRHLLQRLLVAGIRVAAASIAILLVMEFSFVVLGEAKVHVWESVRDGVRPWSREFLAAEWDREWQARCLASGRVLLLAFGSVLLVGYPWGILGARLRTMRGPRLLAAPFAGLACAPGFWLVTLVAAHSYFTWDRPGFGDDLVVEEGPDLLVWWNAAVVAFPAACAAIAWQIPAVARAVETELAAPWMRGLSLAGISREERFYRHALRQARPVLTALLDGTLPRVLGAMVVLETAFRYPGIGYLLVSSVRAADYPGVFFPSLILVTVAALAALFRELFDPPGK